MGNFLRRGYMKDEFDLSEIAALNKDQLVRLRTATRNEITLLRSEQNNGGPDRTKRIAAEQKKLHAIAARLET